MNKVNVYHADNLFNHFDSAYCAVSSMIWNDHLFFGLCTHVPGQSAGFFSFNVITKKINYIFSIDDVLPRTNDSWTHGKIHTKIQHGSDNKFYFATHFAYPNCIPQKIQYEGGCLLSFDPETRLVENCGILMAQEGIVTMTMDSQKMHCYALTTPSFTFIDYDVINKKVIFSCQITDKGSVCRSLGLDKNGNVYGSCENYKIFRYSPTNKRLDFLETNFKEISDATAEWENPKKQGANRVGRSLWRCVEYDDESNKFIGINASNSKLFEFDVDHGIFRNLGPTTNGEYDKVYPTLTLTKLGGKFYYCPADGKFDFQLSEGIKTNCSILSYDIKTGKMTDFGSIEGSKGEKIYGAASAICSSEGKLYMVGAISQDTIENQGLSMSSENIQYSLGIIEVDLFSLREKTH